MVLGVTGSIGTQALEVADRLGRVVEAVAARSPTPLLASLLAQRPRVEVALAAGGRSEWESVCGGLDNHVEFGPEAVAALAARPGRVVLNGIVGSAGLRSSLAALEAGNRLALANKESMVAAGDLVNAARERGGGELIPVDSEHSALHQCLAAERQSDVARLILTASGGPFRRRHPAELGAVTPAEALAHPTWDMGGRISVDSATLVNKGLEVIEAHHLFAVPLTRIEVVVHPQSIVHSAVEFIDGALKAHMGHPDMRVPIQYALTYPHRETAPGDRFDLTGMTLEFEAPDRELFPALDLAYEVGRRGGSAPAVFNAADEVAVQAFLDGEIGFLDITEVIAATCDAIDAVSLESPEHVEAVDRDARRQARQLASAASGSRRGGLG